MSAISTRMLKLFMYILTDFFFFFFFFLISQRNLYYPLEKKKIFSENPELDKNTDKFFNSSLKNEIFNGLNSYFESNYDNPMKNVFYLKVPVKL